jgi:hypothetical protein
VLTRSFNDFITYLLTRYYNLPQDVEPRGGNAYSTKKGKGKKDKGRSKGNKGKGYKGKGKDRSLALDDEFEAPAKHPRLHEHQAQTVEFVDTTLNSDDTLACDTRSNTSHNSNQSRQSSSTRQVSSVHGNNTQDVSCTSNTNPNSTIYYYCTYHGLNLSHYGATCRVVLNDTAYTQKDKQASLPSDLSPRGNDAVEPQRRSQFLKTWGQYK